MACVFCQIIAGQAPAQVVYRDEQVVAFRDIHPAAPVHLLIVPNRHLASLNDVEESQASLLTHMILVARRLAAQEGIRESGYRLVINTGPGAGQTVFHLHLHLLGGRPFSPRLTGRLADSA
jgi:histidine triad (HIT) family protein